MMKIDNTNKTYIPFRFKCGLKACCTLDVYEQCPTILQILENDVNHCLRILPFSVHDLIRRTKLWINVTYVYGDIDHPKVLKHMNTHHYERWLHCINDRPDKVLGIEIYNCFEYLENRKHWNGGGLLLHEFCHLIHQIVLPRGLDNLDIKDMYQNAMKSTLYDEVIRRDWAYLSCDKDAAYATINHKEFFAELSVAFLAKGYQYLDVIDGNCIDDHQIIMDMNKLSPPFQSSEILERQQVVVLQQQNGEENQSKNALFMNFYSFVEKIIGNQERHHCNKFFPFTKRQLEAYDLETYQRLTEIWSFIRHWEDPFAKTLLCSGKMWFSCCHRCCCCGSQEEIKRDMKEPLLDGVNEQTTNEEYFEESENIMGDFQDTVVL